MPQLKKPPAEDWAIIAVMIASLALKLRHLGHRALNHWDEAYHAIVARNLLQHPLTPTLTDKIYFPDNYKNWTLSHIWLHKPILPLWEIAISFRLFGVNTFSLRFPSALLSVAAVWLTYLIGVRLLDRRAALIAATLQAFSPVIFGQVQGYMFADHIDTALLFWVELGIFFLVRTMDAPNRKDIALAGIATGLAYLSKDFLAAIVPALAIVAWILRRLRLSHLAILFATALLTALPWTLWCFFNFRQEFLWEHSRMLDHVNDQIAGWGAPWYRVAYSYLMFLFGWTYLPLLFALIAAIISAARYRDPRLTFLLVWGTGVILSTLFAGTKTPLAAILSLPAAYLLLGWFITAALRGQRTLLPLAAAVMACCVLWTPHQTVWQEILPTPAEFSTHPLTETSWLAWRTGFVLLATVLFLSIERLFPAKWVRVSLAPIIFAGFLILFFVSVDQSYAITSINLNRPSMIQVAAVATEKLPPNAVLLVDNNPDAEANLAFRSSLTVYSLEALERQAGTESGVFDKIRVFGGVPYVVTSGKPPYPIIADCQNDGFTIYTATTDQK